MSDLPFYLLTALTAGCAVGVVLNKNTVHASFCLLLSLLGAAGLFVLLGAYLLAILLVLVYAGAVAALFVFIVMLLGMKGDEEISYRKPATLGAVLTFALLLFGGLLTFTRAPLPSPSLAHVPAFGADLKLYAQQLFTIYLLPVQVAGFLLLIAMIGVIVLSKKKESGAGS
jgi:NADH-quinone oxidoreductase subunit J